MSVMEFVMSVTKLQVSNDVPYAAFYGVYFTSESTRESTR